VIDVDVGVGSPIVGVGRRPIPDDVEESSVSMGNESIDRNSKAERSR